MIFPLIPPVSTRQPVVATGGVITNIAGYRVHTFSAGSSTFQIVSASGPVNLEYLVLAGGGGGGYCTTTSAIAGGGGAGGMLIGSLSAPVRSYPIFVGAGGAGGDWTNNAWGWNGGNSAFDNGGALQVLAHGGGGGAYCNFDGTYYITAAGSNGGCGGGNGYYSNYTGFGVGQGTSGEGWSSSYFASGGGGAGGGGTGATNSGGSGGAGRSSSITGAAVTYGTGGGSGSNVSGRSGLGEGGAGGWGSYSFAGWPGGSGIVIVRYPYP